MQELTIPSLDASIDWLRACGNPTVELALADESSDREVLVAAVHRSEPIVAAFAAQRADGSWGRDDGEEHARILPTLRMLETLSALGAGGHPGAARAIDFLAAAAHVEGGVFSISGRRDGVLSCYVGMAGSIYSGCGALDHAQGQIEWLLRHQEVSRDGQPLRSDKPVLWDSHLRTRYGGCMSSTTCLVGLVKAGRALSTSADERAMALRTAIREAFLERELMFDSRANIVPIGVAPARRDEWLLPTFPLDYRTDVIEVLDVVAHAGPPDSRLQPAIDALVKWRLPDGSWPLRRAFWPVGFPVRERKSLRAGSPIVTLRAARALLGVGHIGRPPIGSDR
jgi:hypothetical protein